MGAFAGRAAWGLLIAILVWAPLPYASVIPWAYHLLAVLAALALALALWDRRRPLRLPWELTVAIAAFLLAVGWGLLQGTPLALLQPLAHPLWSEVGEAGLKVQPTIALAPEGTRDNAVRLLTYGAVFLTALLLAREGERARRLFRLIFVVIALEAAYGLINHFAGWNTVLWEQGPKAYAGTVTGTFVNRNTFATYTGLGVLLGLALLTESLLRTGTFDDFRRRLVALGEEVMGRKGLLLVALVLVVTAHLLTGSRGGFLSLAAGVLLFVIGAFVITRPRPQTAFASLTALALAAWGLLALAGDVTFERLMRADTVDNPRTEAYALAVEMIAERPLAGHGLGSWVQAFQLHRDERFPGFWDRAHNTYLEHAVELGLPATALLYLAAALVFLRTWRGLHTRRRNRIFPLVGVSATVLVAVHSLVDFSLQIPAMAVTYAAIAGIACAQALPRELRRPELSRSHRATAVGDRPTVRTEAPAALTESP